MAKDCEDCEEYGILLDRLSDILTRTANALKGEPKPLHMHDWSDLPEVAAALKEANVRLPNGT